MNKIKIILPTIAIFLITACANTDVPGFSTTEPENMAEQDTINAYGTLKSYVDRSKYPNFKMGGATSASDFNTKDIVYALDKSNYDEIVTDNAFKYASVVQDNGTMDFSTIEDFIKNATEAGLSIYGHTLCWHKQQNIKYLNSLITDPNAINYVLHINIPTAKKDLWDWECYFNLNKALSVDKEYTLKLRIKASKEYQVTVWPNVVNGNTQYWPTPQVNATTEWKTISSTFKATLPINQIRFELGTFSGEIWIDDISLTDADGNNYFDNNTFSNNIDGVTKPGQDYTLDRVPDPDQNSSGGKMTDQFKRDTLTVALGSWIKGMMQVTHGKVKSWDVVNEPMSDSNPDELKTANRDGDPKTNFFWQDYLGKDYARTAIKFARQYGGDSLKLFINDYNLEAAYNNNAKCNGLINMIKYWESDGVTKIDGIGTQMHVSYSLNPATQKLNEEAYVNHLKLLAATGKLIRISELDMGLQDANGNKILTENVTPEEEKAMAEYYKFIVEKYLEIIPVKQQYGITNWSVTDSPKSSKWLPGEPTGLWDENYQRKPAYAGFCDGLQGK
ncbi:MAG TPA: glycosyl hydrolase family 10 [Prevotella sp.]|nr:glycosyl hydrolase family 10 [Prevotella sp.]